MSYPQVASDALVTVFIGQHTLSRAKCGASIDSGCDSPLLRWPVFRITYCDRQVRRFE